MEWLKNLVDRLKLSKGWRSFGFGLLGVFLGLTAAGIFLNISLNKASKAEAYTLEIPEGVDYQDLAPNQEKAIIEQLGDLAPAKEEINITTTVTFVQKNEVIPNNQPPFTGDGQLAPLQPPATDDLKWPTFTFGFGVDNQGDLADAKAGADKTRELVEKYYPKLVELFGLPQNVEERKIAFVFYEDSNFFGYLPQYDSVIVHTISPYEIIPGLLASFYGPYFNLLPETWRYGMTYAAAELAIREFSEDRHAGIESMAAGFRESFEKFNVINYPIWGTKVHYKTDVFVQPKLYRVLLASAAFFKPYQYDQQVFKKVNEKIYELDINGSFWKDDLELARKLESAWPAVEGMSAGEWYGNQHVLHQTTTNPLAVAVMRAIGQTFIVDHELMTGVYKFRSHVTGDDIVFVPKTGKAVKLLFVNDRGVRISEKDMTTDSKGLAGLPAGPNAGLTIGGRYVAKNGGSKGHLHYSQVGTGMVSLYGVVLGFGGGLIDVYNGEDLITTRMIMNGAFMFDKPINGIVRIVIRDYQAKEVFEKELAIYGDRYFAIIDPQTTSFPPASGTGARGSDEDCEDSDELGGVYNSEKWQLQINYPEGNTVYSSEDEPEGYNVTPDFEGPMLGGGVVSFFDGDRMSGKKQAGIIWYRNVDNKSLDDYARDHWNGEIKSTEDWDACGNDVVILTYKDLDIVPGEKRTGEPKEIEGKIYFVQNNDIVFIVNSSVDGLAEKMLKTLKFGE